ncbi:uncharacterized protein LOC128887879 isoform X1 [Hylaeus anthracinus]|uniref:uncharacterized protein LOC128887879 isoform X1 n=2 Tax=Hylaeus anthracinus TaxID=313031 RepID=UPI0023B9D30E|nr:uncharacterized protein LOC128887879 isoform X1 [Hylaeus anthracinus]
MEILTLILDDHRIKVNKERLAKQSRYFASLFSHNFNDSHDKEHVVNYDISLSTLKSFVEWIHDDAEPVDVLCHPLKVSMSKFVKENFIELLNLLQLSVLFMVDELTNEAIDIITINWLLPDKVIDIWLLAQELNIKVLQDMCLATCLDRFEELPLPSLLELTKSNITLLLQNVNTRSSMEYLCFVRNQWIHHHMTPDIPDIMENRLLKFIQGIVVYKTYECINKDPYLYIWKDNVLSKCMQLKHKQDSESSIVGMQVTSRGFNIYTVGGEMGLGTGHFNNIIWRYSLLSKKWYYEAKMPVPRRHMIAVFLKNKLTIIGGVGRHRLKLFTTDILDIHTGTWKKGAKVPESFTSVPPHCVMDGKLFLINTSVFIYYPEGNYWQSISIYNNPAVQRVDAFLAHEATLFLLGSHLDVSVLSRINVVKDSVCKEGGCSLSQCIEHAIITSASIVHEDDSYELRYAHVADVGIVLLNTRHADKYQYLHLHTEISRDLTNFFIPKSGCLNIINPDSLYDTVA